MLRNYLAENGLAPDTDDLNSKAGDVSSRVAQLENKLTESDQEAALTRCISSYSEDENVKDNVMKITNFINKFIALDIVIVI